MRKQSEQGVHSQHTTEDIKSPEVALLWFLTPHITLLLVHSKCQNIHFIPYPTAFPYGNGMVLHFYQQQESSTTKTVHKVINKGLKTYV